MLVPVIFTVALVIPLQVENGEWIRRDPKQTFGLLLALVAVNTLYHVRVMGNIFYRYTFTDEEWDRLEHAPCPNYYLRHSQFTLEDLLEQRKDLDEKIEQMRKEVEFRESQSEESKERPSEDSTQHQMHTTVPEMQAPSKVDPNQDEDYVNATI